MKKILLLISIVSASYSFGQNTWETLLDTDFSKWDTYVSYKLTNAYKGSIPKDSIGNPIPPIGLNNKDQTVFRIIRQDKKPILKVSGEYYGCLVTKNEYQNYHLKLQIKWGDKKFIPRKEKLKDTGIMYHSIGELGTDYFNTWMLSQEFQIMEGHMGDYWSQQSSAIDIRAIPSEGRINASADVNYSFLPFGKGEELSYCNRSANFEKAKGEWNTLELICFEDKSIHIVNGKVVMVLKNSRNIVNGKPEPLTKGKIQLQSEAAEVEFRDIKIKSLNSMPQKFLRYY